MNIMDMTCSEWSDAASGRTRRAQPLLHAHPRSRWSGINRERDHNAVGLTLRMMREYDPEQDRHPTLGFAEMLLLRRIIQPSPQYTVPTSRPSLVWRSDLRRYEVYDPRVSAPSPQGDGA